MPFNLSLWEEYKRTHSDQTEEIAALEGLCLELVLECDASVIEGKLINISRLIRTLDLPGPIRPSGEEHILILSYATLVAVGLARRSL